MIIAEKFLEELRSEFAGTRRMLERVPFEKADFKPHEKSHSLLALAVHIAEMPLWLAITVETDGIDYANFDKKDIIPQDTSALLEFYDNQVKRALDSMACCTDEQMQKGWTFRIGEQVIFTMPKEQVIRNTCINHLIHHRGQLTVYFRLLDVPLPAIYGPTADEK